MWQERKEPKLSTLLDLQIQILQKMPLRRNCQIMVLHIPPKEAKLRIKHQCGFSFDRGDSYSNGVAKFTLTTMRQFLEKGSEGVTMEMKVMTIS